MDDLELLLVDDHEVVRMGLRLLLEDVPGFKLVGEATSADEAIMLCELDAPDVIIMDIRMPGRSGIDACREIVSRWPQISIIVLTSYSDDDLIVDAIKAGAVGYVLKDVSSVELVRTLNAVREGQQVLDPTVTRQIMAMVRERKGLENPFKELSKREMDVLYLLSRGNTNMEIATTLVLSEKTIRNLVSIILAKLNVSNRVEAALFATRHHIQEYLDDQQV